MIHVSSVSGFDLKQLITNQFPYIIHSVLIGQDSAACKCRHYFLLLTWMYLIKNMIDTVLRKMIVNTSSSGGAVEVRSGGTQAQTRTASDSKVAVKRDLVKSKRDSSGPRVQQGGAHSSRSFHTVIDKNPMCMFRILASDVMLR